MTDKEAMKLALFALDIVKIHYTQSRHINEAIAALKERLADPMREVQRLGQEIEQEPICPECKAEVLYECVACSSNNYPPQRTWVGLTDDEVKHEWGVWKASLPRYVGFAKGIEAKLKQKNGFAEEKNAICSPFMISELWRLQK
jgi:hypothetical protein